MLSGSIPPWRDNLRGCSLYTPPRMSDDTAGKAGTELGKPSLSSALQSKREGGSPTISRKIFGARSKTSFCETLRPTPHTSIFLTSSAIPHGVLAPIA